MNAGSSDELPPVEQQINQILTRIGNGEKPPVPEVFRNISIHELATLSERQKQSCWLNAYNAGTQYLLWTRDEEPHDLSFFDTTFEFDDFALSLNDIEHGVLRKNRASDLEYEPVASKDRLGELAVERIDPRIHFALNCGARSCPPIVIYRSSQLETQLDGATERYLAAEATYDEENNTVSVPELFDWFESDFDGPTGVSEFLSTYDVIPDDSTPVIEYRTWDWTAVPRKFQQ